MTSPPSNATSAAFSATDRRALASVAVQFFVNGAAYASFVPRLPEIRERLGVGLDGLGLLLSIAIAAGVLGSLQSPAIIARVGTRQTLAVGGLVMVAALVVIGFAEAPLVFVVALSAMSVADGLIDVSMNLQGSWLSARRHTPVMNRLHGLWSLGTVVGGLSAAQAARAGVSLATHLLVAAALMAACLMFVRAGLLVGDEDHAEDRNEDRDEDRNEEWGRAMRKPTAARPSRPGRRALIVLALAGGFSVTTEMVTSDWAAFRLSEDFGQSLGLAGLAYVAFTVGMSVGRFGGDAAVARLGDGRVLDLAIAISGVSLAVAAFASNRWVVLVAYAAAGIGGSTLFPKLYDDAARLPGRRGRGVAWLRTGSSVAAVVLPATVGVLAATSLSVGASMAIVTLPCVAGLAALRLMPDQTRP